jgi:hypothetical protein
LKRIFYAWELGGGLGHVSPFLPLARALDQRGCAITWALTDLAPAATLLADRHDPVWQAPRYRDTVTGLPEPQLSYSEVLLRHGYLSAASLTPMLHDWRALIEKADPHLVITDHAPTALLAARSLRRACVRIGNGFFCPPALEPEPPLMPRLPPDPARSAESCRRVLESINGALRAVGAAPLAAFAQMHAAGDDIVTTYAELDHYRQRPTPRWGALLGAAGGTAPDWPVQPGVRIFAYLKAHQPQTLPLLRALRRKRYAVLVYCPGLAPRDRAGFEGQALRFSDRPLDIEMATAASDVVICGAGHGTVCAALLAGKPLLLVPEVTEQAITAHNVQAMGAGLVVEPGHESHAGALLTRLLTEPGFARAALDFRFRYAAPSQAQIVQAIAERCMELST